MQRSVSAAAAVPDQQCLQEEAETKSVSIDNQGSSTAML
jgi:hypothetical protein